MACSFGFYMISYYLKYLDGSIFLNAYVSAVAEILGKLSTIVVMKYASLKRVFLYGYGLALFGIFFLITISPDSANIWIPLVLLIFKFGISQAFVVAYLGIILLYPTILTSTAMGICNMLARIASISAPLVAEVRDPINLLILFAICGVAFIGSQCLIITKASKTV